MVAITISEKEDNDGILTFQMDNAHVSIVNALRRVILSEINTVVIRGFPHEENDIDCIKNTCRFNNEVLKHRLINIPIHIADENIDISKYILIIKKKNDTDSIVNITTQDFIIKHQNGSYLSNEAVQQIFPPNNITKEYILFTRLRPAIGTHPGEEIHIEATFTRSNAMEDSAYNCVSTCSYIFTPDKVKQKQAWDVKRKSLDSNVEDDEILRIENDFYAIDAKRIYKSNSFQFTIESIGVYENDVILKKACYVLQQKCNDYKEKVETKEIEIKDGDCVNRAFDIILENDNYTFGKILEYALYELYFKNEKSLSFISYKKTHPHDDYSFIRVMFKDDNMDANNIYGMLKEGIRYNEILLESILQQI